MSYASFVISSHVPNECEGTCEKSLPKKDKVANFMLVHFEIGLYLLFGGSAGWQQTIISRDK